MFVVLKPFEERTGHPEQSADAIVGQAARRPTARCRRASRWCSPRRRCAASAPPAGSSMQVAGPHRPAHAAGTAGRHRAAHGRRRARTRSCAGIFSSFRANVPQLYVNVDRTKVKTAERAGDRRVPGAAGLPRLAVHQRLQLPGPHLPRDGPGRRAVPRPRRRRRRAQDPQRAPARWCRSGAVADIKDIDRPRPHQPLQPLPVRRDQRRRRPRRQQRAGHRRHGADCAKPTSRRATATSGPSWPSRRRPPATPRCSSSRCASCSSCSPTPPSTRASRSPRPSS